MWCCAMPMDMVGATMAPTASPAQRAISSEVIASVPIRPLGPCCSVEPIGTMMPVLFSRYASTSGQVASCSCIPVPFLGRPCPPDAEGAKALSDPANLTL